MYDGIDEYWVTVKERGTRKDTISREEIDREKQKKAGLVLSVRRMVVKPWTYDLDQEGAIRDTLPENCFGRGEACEALMDANRQHAAHTHEDSKFMKAHT